MNHTKKRFPILLFFLLVLFIFGFSNCKKKGYQIISNPYKIVDNNGVERKYKLFYPPNNGKELPLLIYFHGVRSDGFKNIPVLKGYTGSPLSETGLIRFCKIKRIALLEIVPSYTYKFMGVESYGWSPFKKEIDGIEKCIDTVIDKFDIDEGNVFLAGISAGAVMTHHLANRRPLKYKAILSHSQAYISEDNRLLEPRSEGKKFGVVFSYTKGDYKNLKEFCEDSYKIYKSKGFNTMILRDLPPKSHKWSDTTNRKFWKALKKVGEAPQE